MGIPTVVLDGGNFVGAFEGFDGFCNMNEIQTKIDDQIKTGRDVEYIDTIIEGGVGYNSITTYVNQILEKIDKGK